MALVKDKSLEQQVIPTGVLRRLSPDDIKPSQHNPRHLFDQPELDALKRSIRDKGVLVPITVYQPKGQSKVSILDGERRYRCVLELRKEGFLDLDLPANVVQPPSRIAGLLYMFNIHNFRESWELMPTALGLKIVISELGDKDTRELTKLTGLSEAQVERCRKLLAFPEKFQLMSLEHDPKTRIPSNFWIEALPVLELIDKELPVISEQLGRDRITDKLVNKYRQGKIKSVIHFRRIMEAYELSDGNQTQRDRLIRRLEEFLLKPGMETRASFDEFVVDQKRARTAISRCEAFMSDLQHLKLAYTSDDLERQSLRDALRRVEEYCVSLRRTLEGRDDPEVVKNRESEEEKPE
jgi:ParB/RepB/Spo0J family partition protein